MKKRKSGPAEKQAIWKSGAVEHYEPLAEGESLFDRQMDDLKRQQIEDDLENGMDAEEAMELRKRQEEAAGKVEVPKLLNPRLRWEVVWWELQSFPP